jgi:hypothetical protein
LFMPGLIRASVRIVAVLLVQFISVNGVMV